MVIIKFIYGSLVEVVKTTNAMVNKPSLGVMEAQE